MCWQGREASGGEAAGAEARNHRPCREEQGQGPAGTPSHGARDFRALEPDVREKNSPRTSQLEEADPSPERGGAACTLELDLPHRNRAPGDSPALPV